LAWPWAADPSSSSFPARNYLAEVFHATGDHEVLFDASRTSLVHQYAEVLSATAAPPWQREAPRTLAQAHSRPDVDRWVAAMQEELASLHSKQVYDLVQLPAGHKSIDLRYYYFHTRYFHTSCALMVQSSDTKLG
jgi:hypothetical protein